MQHIIEGLRDAGVTDFLLVVGWHAEVVFEIFWRRLETRSAHQLRDAGRPGRDRQSGRTGARLRAEPTHFVLSYGDILVAPENYQRICAALPGAEAVISVKRNEDVSQGGAVFVNDEFEMIDLREKPKPGEPTSPWYNAGIYAFRPSIFDFIAKLERSPRGEYELTDAIRELAQAGNKVQALELTGDWADVRDPEILAQLNR